MTTLIYHITHISNLPNILQDGELWCDAERIRRGYSTENIAYEHIKQRRFSTFVTVGTKRILADFTPFYFCNRSPMLCAIFKGGVTGREDTQSNIIYLVSSVEKVINEGSRAWCFSDGHGVEKLTDFYDDLNDLDKIDWPLIRDWHWNNTLEDNDRIRRKQAEFLVYQSLPVSWIKRIGVYNQEQKVTVDSILKSYNYKIPVSVEPKWYYSKKGKS